MALTKPKIPYEHIIVLPETDKRFDAVKRFLIGKKLAEHKRPEVTDDEAERFLLDLFEQEEAKVKP